MRQQKIKVFDSLFESWAAYAAIPGYAIPGCKMVIRLTNPEAAEGVLERRDGFHFFNTYFYNISGILEEEITEARMRITQSMEDIDTMLRDIHTF